MPAAVLRVDRGCGGGLNLRPWNWVPSCTFPFDISFVSQVYLEEAYSGGIRQLVSLGGQGMGRSVRRSGRNIINMFSLPMLQLLDKFSSPSSSAADG